jgi:hypothetical protein
MYIVNAGAIIDEFIISNDLHFSPKIFFVVLIYVFVFNGLYFNPELMKNISL